MYKKMITISGRRAYEDTDGLFINVTSEELLAALLRALPELSEGQLQNLEFMAGSELEDRQHKKEGIT